MSGWAIAGLAAVGYFVFLRPGSSSGGADSSGGATGVGAPGTPFIPEAPRGRDHFGADPSATVAPAIGPSMLPPPVAPLRLPPPTITGGSPFAGIASSGLAGVQKGGGLTVPEQSAASPPPSFRQTSASITSARTTAASVPPDFVPEAARGRGHF